MKYNNNICSFFLAGLILGAAVLNGCSSAPKRDAGIKPAMHTLETVSPMGDRYVVEDVYDPWEPFNRSIYKFNARFDEYIFLPVVSGYEYITLEFMQTGVSNFFSNLREIRNFINSVLQAKSKSSLHAVSRFAINTTVGIAGLFDPATAIGINKREEDFGQTLGNWGLGTGPYIVLPILGPSNLRDTGGLSMDSYIFSSAIDPLQFEDHRQRQIAYLLLNSIDTRHRFRFRYYQSGTPFEYEWMRLLYSNMREFEIAR